MYERSAKPLGVASGRSGAHHAIVTRWWISLIGSSLGVVVVCLAVALLTIRPSRYVLTQTADVSEVPAEIDGHIVEAQFGKQLFLQNCSTCHGVDGTGMPKQGANLRDSIFVLRRTNAQLLGFLRVGRIPGDRDTVLNLTMPPRGGNPHLEDDELADIVAYLRLVQRSHAATSRTGGMQAGGT